jgi:DNA-directed RNA polymerase subunit alpha
MVKVNIKYDQKDKAYGVFEVEPLERGFGTTIGNSIRRVLLSSLEGAAISSVIIDGVEHEFATIDGIKEDVLDILMNLKSIVVKSYSESPKEITLIKKGPGTVTAGDIEHDDEIEILNKNQHIATLNKNGKLEMKMTVTRGKGYVPAELLLDGKKGPVNMMYLDASYSPVLKVNHVVEPIRVGKQIDFDKLIIEVWTNGSISPEDAVKKSSVILQQQLSVFDKPQPTEENKVTGQVKAQDNGGVNGLSIDELNISSRTSNSLKRAGIMTIGELIVKPVSELMQIRNFGKKALLELNEKLIERKLSLKGDIDINSISEEE